ncbi:hypothetical protein MHTCC0001_10020 [Flavobacteriaceae bacterium MHTCC 0001]
MLKNAIILCCILVVVSSCYNYNKPDKPKNLISKDKMVGILLDLKLIESVTGRDKKVLDSAKVIPEHYVYKKYNIDSVQFAESNAYYAYFMDDYADIYQRVKDSLNTLKAQYQEILDEEKKKDSIAKAKKKLEERSIDIKKNIKAEDQLKKPTTPVSNTK